MHIHARQPGRGWPCRHGQSRAASTPPACGDSGHRAAGARRPPPAHSALPGHGGLARPAGDQPLAGTEPSAVPRAGGGGPSSGVPSGAGRGGCAAARGALGAARAAQTKETRTDTHTAHTHTLHRDTCPLPSRGAEPPALHRANLEIEKRQKQSWDETRRPGWWSCSLLASRCSLCRHPLFDLLPGNHF